MAEFIHLHNHSHYSLLDGACKIKDLVNQAVAFNMPALALTDHGNMFGAIEFYKTAKKAGIKPIIGSEMYIAPGSRHERAASQTNGAKDTAFHLVLLAKNQTGYINLMKLVSIGYLEGFYYKPRIDREVLAQYSEGLIALSACLKGEVPRMIVRDNMERAEQIAREYKELFGDDYYLEIQDHDIPEEKQVVKGVLELSKKLDIKVVAANDVHYLKREHNTAHDILLCLQTGKDYDDPHRMRYTTDQVYFKSADEMTQLFGSVPDSLKNTLEIAEKCNLDLEFNTFHLPHFDLPDEYKYMSLDEYLAEVSSKALPDRYPVVTPDLRERLAYELNVIKTMGYAGYFLIVKDFIDYARSQGIPVGPGRGSAAGSLVSYVIGITNFDPMKYNLLFERFLNPERVTMPDIDIDFCYERREEIIKWVREKYGHDNVTQIITFGTMAARAVIRDVGRVLKMSYGDVDKIAKMIPAAVGMTIGKAFDMVPELRQLEKKDEVHEKLLENARILEGLARHSSTHAAGVIITPEELTKYTPLYKSTQGDVTSQYDGGTLETIGVLKMDFLGLRTLTVIQKTLDSLKTKNIVINLDKIPIDDINTYKIFCNGETIGIFQFESSGMREYLKKLQPQCLEDLIAMNALYRPGPMDMIDEFIQRKKGLVKIEYMHSVLEPILKETYGVIVYQEQVMQIASAMAGFSLGKADLLRRAMGKKKVELMKEQRKLFLEGAAQKSISEKIANAVFDHMDKFAGYGFNKSHAACYSFVAYQTAYLKAHYPEEFMAANLTSEMGDTSRVVILIDECKRMGINILPPDVNESEEYFMPTDKGIRFGLGAVKNVGKGAIRSIIEARQEHGKFITLFELCEHIDTRQVNKKVLESLIQAGAMDSLDGHRALLLANIDLAVSYGQAMTVRKSSGQTNIFDMSSETNVGVDIPKMVAVEEWDKAETLAREKTMMGFYLSGHPLARYKSEVQLFSSGDFMSFHDLPDNTAIRACGIITLVKIHYDKKKRPMAFITLEDFTSTIEVIAFADGYAEYGKLLQVESMVLIEGKINIKSENDDPKILVDKVMPLADVWEHYSKTLCLAFRSDEIEESTIRNVQKVIEQHKGRCPVMINVIANGGNEYLLRARRMQARPNPKLIHDLQASLGERNVWVEM
ncbi:DNA polymerase III subunit alpha [candidate division KSB1 bacterium]|nr:DNA polymerase III subunit alpha [candidate division KSB1 bacterium]